MGKPVGGKMGGSMATLHTDASTQLFLETRTRHDVIASRRAGFCSSVCNETMVNMRALSFRSHVSEAHRQSSMYEYDICHLFGAEVAKICVHHAR